MICEKDEKDIEALSREICPPDREAMEKAAARQEELAKVPGSLGRLEDISIRMAGITGNVTGNDLRKQCIAVFCGDNGVVAEGVASAPQTVTLCQTINFTRRITGMSAQARYFGIDVLDVDMGVAEDIPEELYTDSMLTEDGSIPVKIVNRSIARGTKNLAKEPAMTRRQAIQGILTGFEAADAMKKAGIQLCGIGEMGIGNTTTSSCLLSAVTGVEAEDLVGRGGGLNNEGLETKIRIVREAGERCRDMDPIGKLAAVGGFDLCAMTGCYLGAARNRMPVVIDGFISIVAAVMAREIQPLVTHYMFASHKSTEVGYNTAMERLGLKPMFDLGMRLGEGSGCPVAFKIMEAGCASMNLMKTLAEGSIDAGYLEEIKKGNFF
ncbi:nicotinate-nucleotide--dimethylbenzimidazole phosphoribosyltransferase [Hornefia butyriciproducens]|uniref:nicotinate-nucleotide--dimethylbenzimidazole phosphoribosyltransferase n=1 Tax=Hornefia butyriciproducens TaxID=2652293 RepID=UPI0029FA6799|nr:nicotinate-nucleotide--dimethylbenzimidazole phosphoribosyltransferase [Hornefia butyriciproducens]